MLRFSASWSAWRTGRLGAPSPRDMLMTPAPWDIAYLIAVASSR